MNAQNQSLFREEVIAAKQDRLHGKVIVKQTISALVMTAVLVAVIAIAVIWITVGKYARTEQVRGTLSTTLPSSKIVAPQAGLLTKLNISEGQLVKKGQVLAVIDIDRRSEEGGAFAEASLQAIDNRLSLTKEQASIAGNLAKATQRELQQIAGNAERQIGNIQDQIALQRTVVASNQSLFDKIGTLVERGFVSQIDYEGRKQNLLNSQQGLARLEQQLITVQGERARALADLSQSRLSAAQEMTNIGSTTESLVQQRAQMKGEKSYVINAPISGRVTAIQAAQGKTARPNVALMTIIPEGSDLEAVLYAPTRAIGFVKKGQETRLLLDAFPYQRFGSFEATISEVSRTVLDPREADVPFQMEEPVYKVRAKLRKQAVNAFGENVPLQPGMTLTGNIVLERQSFLDWILTPLRAVVNRN